MTIQVSLSESDAGLFIDEVTRIYAWCRVLEGGPTVPLLNQISNELIRELASRKRLVL